MDAHLIDRIYECSFVPESWPEVLGDLAKLATARAGFLFISNDNIHRWTSSSEIGVEALQPLVSSGWVARSERFRRLLAARHAGFMTEAAIYNPEELPTDPFYRDVLYPRGLGWAAGTAVPMPTGDTFTVSLEREYSLGPVESSAIETLNSLRPHIARSALMAARLQLERARTTSETLSAVGIAALVLDEGGKVLAANSLIEGATGYVQWRAQDRISLHDRDAGALLQESIASLNIGRQECVRSFPVRNANSPETMVAHLIPIRLSARDIFARCAAVLLLTPVSLPQAPPVELVQSLFDLTPTEARVARSLAGGKTVEAIASENGVSLTTVRTHVRGILGKTGRNRQAEIVALLTGIFHPG